MATTADVLGTALIAMGCFLVIVGGIGLLRMPEFFTRMHAASVVDTMGAFSILVGVGLRIGFDLALFKILSIILLLAVTGPTANHALAKAAIASSLSPKDENGEDLPSNP